MTVLSVIKCWMTEEQTYWLKWITILITVGSGITGYFVLYKMLPTPASPQVNDIFFYANGNQGDFSYCYEFTTRNDGDSPCKMEKVELVLKDVKFKTAKSALLAVGLGGGGGGGRYGGSRSLIEDEVTNSYLPQSLSSMNQTFRFIGHGDSSTIKPKNFTDGGDNDIDVVIKFYFKSNNKPIVLERKVPITSRNINNMRF